ncbi:hypothetical protein [Actinoallomurus rhizosphaericola]|uniref:hypothetical protein n=1 Tax=Actinoallomurus rhizosphaericola TaxID=2952536 RepID=UPI002091F29E|nr:hypothetical protein [Actinoallomurus rhizosphaericola]MCO5997619.1 hypothetical protein [Actinoallomurus rhizosphaericola]
MTRAAAVILWALTVTVVILVHGAGPHDTHAAVVLASIQDGHPVPLPCPASRTAGRFRSDPGDGGRPTPWGHCDAVLHRAPAPPPGPGAQHPRPSAVRPAETADPRSTAPRRADRSAHPRTPPEPARLQVFRC